MKLRINTKKDSFSANICKISDILTYRTGKVPLTPIFKPDFYLFYQKE